MGNRHEVRVSGPSVLSGLFRRVSDPDSTRDALEDFTTEALAGAIRRDPRPMLSALSMAGAFDASRVSGQSLTVHAQRAHSFAAYGIRLDLVLVWPTSQIELWIEVKTGAPLSGVLQLERYMEAQRLMTEADSILRPPLVLLSDADLRFGHAPEAIDTDRLEPGYLAWQDLIEAAATTPDVDSLWLELAMFLKEKGMTQDTAFPISAREATSLGDSYRLYQKAVRLLTEVNTRASTRLPQLEWWTTGIPVFVQKQFRDKGRHMLGIWNQSKIGLLFGLEAGRTDEAMYTVWLETDPRNAQIRPQVHGRAESGQLHHVGWEREFEGWKLVEARAHTINFATLDQAADWFIGRFLELESAGLLELIQQFRSGGADLSEEAIEESLGGPSSAVGDSL